MTHIQRLLGLAAVAVALLASGISAARANDQALRIVATIPPYAMLARAVAGENAEVAAMVQRGHDPHHFDPTVSAMARLRRADAVIRNGIGMRPVEDHIQRTAGDPSLFTVAEAAAFEPIRGPGGETNPHIWLDPDVMAQAAHALADRLGQLRPEAAERFAANANAFGETVTSAEAQCRKWLQELPTRKLVTFHPGFDYFFRHFNLEAVGTYRDLAGNEPGSRGIAELLATIRRHQLPALFREPQLPANAARSLAEEAGVDLAVLDPLGFAEGIDGYPDLLRYNARQVRDAYRP
ncbi:metal ABC transporter substrate-binding protein [Thiohalorhabdus sp.]|uniref:metal ABC transporter substrate-binding protein n=1 Tax=Thiohalorhabdus sp. TaxID=3094134 RepID=UPI002FC2EDBC